MSKKLKLKKKEGLSMYGIDADAAVSAALKIDPEHKKKTHESSDKSKQEPNHDRIRAEDD